MEFALEIADLHKSFGSLEVIQGLSLRLPAQQTLALLGPSGCGKSTVLNLLSGLENEYSGEIVVLGRRLGHAKRPQIGYMLQKDLLLPWRTIEQNVFLPRRIKQLRTHSRAQVDALFVLFGLEAFRKSYPRELSGGMRQRANLLRTYSLQSNLLLLDEPFGALDALTRQSLQHWFLEMSHRQPRSILLVTHDIREAILLADQIIVLSPRPCRSLAHFDVRTNTHSAEQQRELEAEIFTYLDTTNA